jgi:hypothetical protein
MVPAGVSSAEDRLRYYAERFPVVEVDSCGADQGVHRVSLQQLDAE